MAVVTVQALYDFSGEPGTAELSIKSGDVLTVTRKDVGEGWWEGKTPSGQTGLFPAAYVQEIAASQPPAMPPPPLPDTYNNDDWGDNQTSANYANTPQNYDAGDDWDDEWDDDSESGSRPAIGHQGVAGPISQVSKSGSAGDVSSIGRYNEGKGTVGKKNFNRFSSFVKSGGESYILGTLQVAVPDGCKVWVVDGHEGPIWSPNPEPYSCVVAQPKKETKLKGLKSFIAYQLTPSFNNIQVSRRYKHFDWLHERLEEKFSLIPIPPLPDKQISGRYEEQFIEHRKNQLQLFVDSVCRHPVLSRCEVWQHFLTCTDKNRWKQGKRRAENDKLVGANYFFALQAPEAPITLYTLELETDNCAKFVQGMDGAVKNLLATAYDQSKKHQGPYKREYQRIGQAFTSLGQSFEEPASSPRANLSVAIKMTGEAYNEIGRLFEEQPKLDWEPLGDVLHLYRGIIASFPDILTVHKGALQKRRECEKLTADHKMEQTQLTEVTRRTDVVSYALLSEINHFHSERAEDFKQGMKKYLNEQILFYEKIVLKLKEAVAVYED
ncbi:sorting nexin lst-4 [Frankliniella occidentalis]|uniref:Sorting nexin n=1 Tax=Frankliniella occidentalis TaxID=133901 RepID=A0A6J1S975_FRAOC|nr:sorting nexin lst-4 [Frankliniella occidentalis]